MLREHKKVFAAFIRRGNVKMKVSSMAREGDGKPVDIIGNLSPNTRRAGLNKYQIAYLSCSLKKELSKLKAMTVFTY